VGTVVSVRDAFYNARRTLPKLTQDSPSQQLPVRRRTHPSPSRSIESIKKDLQSLALVFPHVWFTLEDTSKDHHLNQVRGKILSISKASLVCV